MIAIQNVSKIVKDTGVQEYEIRINRKIITRFTHKREKGLAECLQAAAEAVKKIDENEQHVDVCLH